MWLYWCINILGIMTYYYIIIICWCISLYLILKNGKNVILLSFFFRIFLTHFKINTLISIYERIVYYTIILWSYISRVTRRKTRYYCRFRLVKSPRYHYCCIIFYDWSFSSRVRTLWHVFALVVYIAYTYHDNGEDNDGLT